MRCASVCGKMMRFVCATTVLVTFLCGDIVAATSETTTTTTTAAAATQIGDAQQQCDQCVNGDLIESDIGSDGGGGGGRDTKNVTHTNLDDRNRNRSQNVNYWPTTAAAATPKFGTQKSVRTLDDQQLNDYRRNLSGGFIGSDHDHFDAMQRFVNGGDNGAAQDDITTNAVQEKAFLQTIGNKFATFSAPFDAAHIASASAECKLHTRLLANGLHNLDMWAVRMHDASAKFPSGILSGNVNQYGDFDECLAVNGKVGSPTATGLTTETIRGKYCLAYMQPEVPDTYAKLKLLHSLIQSHGPFKSEFNDSGHRVPRMSSINWAICVPAACTDRDVETWLRQNVENITDGTGFHVKVRVDAEMCQTADRPFDPNTYVAAGFFAIIIVLVGVQTVYDYKVTASNKNPWLVCFSLRKNVRNLTSTRRDVNDIASVHGIRFFNALMLIIAHKSMALFFNPYVNRTEMSETMSFKMLGQPWTVIGRAASLYTDPFIMLSGLLTTYSLIGRLQRAQSIKLIQEYVGRLLRIVPTLGALILFCTYILPLLGSGPQWNLVVTHHSDICKTYWWRNLLFIHNYYGFEKMCLTHTHHIGIDTQLFVLAPLFVMILWKWPRKGGWCIFGLAAISTIARYYVTMTRHLSNYVFFGTSVAQLFDTADHMYILPAHRLTVYLMGIGLGYVLRMRNDIKLSKTQLKVGWYVNVTLVLASVLGPAPMGAIDYVYNPTHAAHYAAFAPIAWCSFFGWIIFTSQLGYHTILSDLLSWKGFLITTKLSYAVYLTQFPVFFFNVGQTRSTDSYNFFRMNLNTNEFLWVVFTSATLTLLFETPFQNIKRLLFNRTPPTKLQSSCNGGPTVAVNEAVTPLKTEFVTNTSDSERKTIVYDGGNVRCADD